VVEQWQWQVQQLMVGDEQWRSQRGRVGGFKPPPIEKCEKNLEDKIVKMHKAEVCTC